MQSFPWLWYILREKDYGDSKGEVKARDQNILGIDERWGLESSIINKRGCF